MYEDRAQGEGGRGGSGDSGVSEDGGGGGGGGGGDSPYRNREETVIPSAGSVSKTSLCLWLTKK